MQFVEPITEEAIRVQAQKIIFRLRQKENTGAKKED